MTWSFLYLAILLVGLVLAAATGALRRHRHLHDHHRHFVLPHADHVGTVGTLLARRASVVLAGFGLAGLLADTLLGLPRNEGLAVAIIVAGLLGLAVMIFLRARPCATDTGGRATAVREILPGGYGQIRIEQGGRTIVMAAQSTDDQTIPAGVEVKVVDCDRSVVRVQRLKRP